MARMNLSLEDELYEQLAAAVPPRKRSRFVAEAIRDRLLRQAQIEAAQASAGAWQRDKSDDPTAEIRRSREGWSERSDRLPLSKS